MNACVAAAWEPVFCYLHGDCGGEGDGSGSSDATSDACLINLRVVLLS